jgi:methylated-DNA-[protein]-cysteine S-methyltransferase
LDYEIAFGNDKKRLYKSGFAKVIICYHYFMENRRIYKTPIGNIVVSEKGLSVVKAELARKDASVKGHKETPFLKKVGIELKEYFEGKRKRFSFKIELEGTAFQKKVWKALLEIPYGQTRSYKDIARAVGNPKGARAVGGANNKNPLMIFVPCHRVINADGGLGGYACGIAAKKILLDLEISNNKEK